MAEDLRFLLGKNQVPGYQPLDMTSSFGYDSPVPPPVVPTPDPTPTRGPAIQLPKVSVRDPLGTTPIVPGSTTVNPPPVSTTGATFYQPPQAPQGPQFATATTTSRSTRRKLVDDTDLQTVADAGKKRIEANEEYASKLTDFATKQAAIMDSQREANEKAEAEFQARHQEEQAEVERHLARQDELQAELNRRSEEGFTDFWADKSTGTKIAALAGAVFGGALEGFTQGRVKNTFMTHLNAAIDRDLRKQLESRRELGRAIKGQASLIQMTRSIAGSDKEAILRAKLLANETAKNQLSQLNAIATTAEQKARLAEANAAIEESSAKLRIDLAPTVQTNVQSKRVPVGPGASGAPADPNNPVPGWKVNMGVFKQLGSAEQAKARNSAGAFESAMTNLRSMKAIREDVGAETFDTAESQEFANRSGAVLSALGTMLEMGTMQESDIKRVEKMIGGSLSPEFINDTIRLVSLGNYDAVRNRLDGAETAIKTILLPKLEKMGVTPAGGNITSFRKGTQ